MAALSVQTGRGDVADALVSRRGQEDEVAGKSLIFFHKDDVSDLRQTALCITYLIKITKRH